MNPLLVSTRWAQVGGGYGSMLAKVDSTPATLYQLDLLLQPTYTQVIQRLTIGNKTATKF